MDYKNTNLNINSTENVSDFDKSCIRILKSSQIISPPALCPLLVTPTQPKQTASLLRYLNKYVPLNQFMHLKRVNSTKQRSNRLTLQSPSSINTPQDDNKEIKEEGEGHVNEILILICPPDKYSTLSDDIKLGLSSFNLQPISVLVPRFPPSSEEELKEAKTYWPISSQPPRPIEQISFDSNQQLLLYKYMNLALSAAIDEIKRDNGQLLRGTVIVDPSTDTILAITGDKRNSKRINVIREYHILHHSTIVAINMAATKNLAAWEEKQEKRKKIKTLTDQVQDQHKYSTNSDCIIVDSVFEDNHSNRLNIEPNEETDPYLCTGYDIYLTHEPCIM